MASQQTPATMENSPAESLLSVSGDDFPSLFPTSDAPSPTINPVDMDMMTPASFDDRETPSRLSAVPEEAGTPGNSEKKSSKKRKSWGQVLPEPKTNLPPRKRAKTEDEKEQRRVERVLRNRRAAQSSRERKRQEVVALEERNKELEEALDQARQANYALMEQLKRQSHDSGVMAPAVPTGSTLQHTLSSQLFGQGVDAGSLDNLVPPSTVNPASLTPEPVEQDIESIEQPSEPAEPAKAASSNTMTQRPAVSDVGAAEPSAEFPGVAKHDASGFSFDMDSFGIPETTGTDIMFLEGGLLDSPQSSYLDDDHLAGDSASLFPFDINEWVETNQVFTDIASANNDSGADMLGLEPQGFHPESQAPHEDPFQQPEPGASSLGCDVRGIAVGV